MFLGLILPILASVAVIYIPGYLIGRILRFDEMTTLLIAPIISTFTYVSLGILLDYINVSCNPIILFAISVGIGIAMTSIRAVITMKSPQGKKAIVRVIPYKPLTSIAVVLVYFTIAALITYFVFVSALETPDALARFDDNTAHYSRIRTFLETGTYSTNMGGFYPSAWHISAAIVAMAFNENVSLAANSQLIVFLVCVIPSGLFLLLTQVFESKKMVTYGALFSVSFSAFPWGFIEFGQLTPNMMSFAFIPPTLAIYIHFVQAGNIRKHVPRVIAFSVIALVAIAIAQPNGLFTLGILLTCYLAFSSLFNFADNRFVVTRRGILVAALIIGLAIVLWVLLFYLPALQGVINVNWSANHSFFGAIREALLFVYTTRGGMQLFMSAMVFVGVLNTLKNRRYLWLTIAYAFTLLLYAIGDSTDGVLKHFATGFWYTDPFRTAAMNVLCAMPIAVLGFSWLVGIISNALFKVIERFDANGNHQWIPTLLGTVILTIVMATLQFTNIGTFPVGNRTPQTGLLAVRDQIVFRYSSGTWLTSDEISFARDTMEIIPDGACVINIPNDGSEWLHGYLGLNTYFRRVVHGDSSEKNELIRGHLNEIATSQAVQDAVKDAGAHYVLLLDDKTAGNNTILDDYAYNPERWAGIDSITNETEGFELILSRDDMRLYKIDDKYFE